MNKFQISNTARQQLQAALASLTDADKSFREFASRIVALTDEQAGLETKERLLSFELASESDGKELLEARSRLSLLPALLRSAERQLTMSRQNVLSEFRQAGVILHSILAPHFATLLDIATDAFAPFYWERGRARNVAGMTDAVRAFEGNLNGLMNANVSGTPDEVVQRRGHLEAALRGNNPFTPLSQ